MNNVDLIIHRFVESGGREVVDGKSKYPDMIRLELTRQAAIDLAMSMIRQVTRTGTDEPYRWDMFGKMTQEDE